MDKFEKRRVNLDVFYNIMVALVDLTQFVQNDGVEIGPSPTHS